MTIVLLLFFAALVLGPKKMVGVSRRLGQWYSHLERAKSQLAREFEASCSDVAADDRRVVIDAAGPAKP